MECDRLKRLVKNWYAQVQDETMAPARMVTFMRQHIADCTTCLADPFARQEVDKIIEIILPANKYRNAADEEETDHAVRDEGPEPEEDEDETVDDRDEEEDEVDDEDMEEDEVDDEEMMEEMDEDDEDDDI